MDKENLGNKSISRTYLITPEIEEKINSLCTELERSKSWVVREALLRGCDNLRQEYAQFLKSDKK